MDIWCKINKHSVWIKSVARLASVAGAVIQAIERPEDGSPAGA